MHSAESAGLRRMQLVGILLLVAQICGYNDFDRNHYCINAYAAEAGQNYGDSNETASDSIDSENVISYDEENRSYYDDDDAVIERNANTNTFKGKAASDPKDNPYTGDIVKALKKNLRAIVKKCFSNYTD